MLRSGAALTPTGKRGEEVGEAKVGRKGLRGGLGGAWGGPGGGAVGLVGRVRRREGLEGKEGLRSQKRCWCELGCAGSANSAIGPADLDAGSAEVRGAAPNRDTRTGGRRVASRLAASWTPSFRLIMAGAVCMMLGRHGALGAAEAVAVALSHWGGGCLGGGQHRRGGKSSPRRCLAFLGEGDARGRLGSACVHGNSTAMGNRRARTGGGMGREGVKGGGPEGKEGDMQLQDHHHHHHHHHHHAKRETERGTRGGSRQWKQ